MPAFPSETGSRHEFGWGRGDAPAGRGSRRQVDQILLGQCPPAPDDESGHAGGFSRQLQAPRGGEPHARDLADDGRQPLLTQAFLDEGQDLAFPLGFGIDHPVRVQTCAQEAGSEQVAARQAPEHRTLEPGRDSCGEQGGAASELRGMARLDHLMKNASGEAASWQVSVERLEAKGQQPGFL